MKNELNIILNSNASPDRKALKKYHDSLLREIRKNPDNIEAYSLLSIIKLELLSGTKVILKYLKKAINNNSINDKQYAMLATNTAYILITEPTDDNSLNEALTYLTEAIKRNSAYPETYYGLGMYFYKDKNLKKALQYLQQATELSNNEKYAKAYASCLISDKQYDNALQYITLINEKSLKLFLTAVIKFNKNDFAKTKQLLDNINESDYIYYSYEIAKLYLAIGEYQKFTDIIDNENYYFDKELAHYYSYSMNKLGQSEKAYEKLHLIINETEEIIADTNIEDFEKKKEYTDFIKTVKNEINEIIEGFSMKNSKPIYTFDFQPDTDCYYIGCPRHSNI